ncbi:lysophospholipid acyltransferase family protein [Camelimonas abortus]|uniref:Lysophospholipid acyltransferase family protein n=1 Tax=Camelimonas abortus TaxID=1017184 RepID=A0ABV7LH03_9HYPH
MRRLRAILFLAIFYVNTAIWSICAIPVSLLGREAFMPVIRAWVRCTLWLLRAIAGVKVEFRNLAAIPPGPLLVASKHQSALETLALVLAFDRPVFILKKSLTRIPLFGWYLKQMGHISVDRSAGAAALRAMMAEAKQAVAEGAQIVIFPEGTRTAPGAPPDYKPGVIQMYRQLGAPCLPVALNTGLFWPRRSLAFNPGVAVIEILPPLPADLGRNDIIPALEAAIEPASRRLLEEGRRGR